jgi:hypothetical protein
MYHYIDSIELLMHCWCVILYSPILIFGIATIYHENLAFTQHNIIQLLDGFLGVLGHY